MLSSALISAARIHKAFIFQLGCRFNNSRRPTFIAPTGRKSRFRSALLGNEEPEKICARVEEAEHMQDWIESNIHDQSQATQIVDREISKLKHSLVKKIIEKKYFKTPQETNFLSWDAKEQIRYLHAEFPDEWTAERIATSFPISEEGVKKILNSKRLPKSPEDIIKHDQRVQKHWIALNQGAHTDEDPVKGGGPLARLEINMNPPLQAAAADSSPQLERVTMLSSGLKVETFTDQSDVRKFPGLFESIVKDYCEKTRKVTTTSRESVKKAIDAQLVSKNSEQEQNRRSVPRITASTAGDLSLDELRSKFKSKSVNRADKGSGVLYKTMKRRTSLPDVDFDNEPDSKYNDFSRSTDIDAGDDERLEQGDENKRMSAYVHSEECRPVVGRRRRELSGRTRRKENENNEFVEPEDRQVYAMKGTDKISDSRRYTPRGRSINSGRSATHMNKREKMEGGTDRDRISRDSKYYDRDVDERETGYDEGIEEMSATDMRGSADEYKRPQGFHGASLEEFEKFSRNTRIKPSSAVSDSIRYDSPAASRGRRNGAEGVEGYMYDTKTGYSHPFGRRSDLPEPRVTMSASSVVQRSGSATYRKGNAYYDEDGELLYRIP